MAFVYDSSLVFLGVQGWLNKLQSSISSLFTPSQHSPEADLLSGVMRDARLVPRVPMDNANIDVGLLAQLSGIGLKRAKEVTDASHPELMQAWRAMSQRAGLAKPPQLIIAESPSLNALTVSKDEVTITTGLLRILDLREATAVLGHELGHVQSDHIKPRVLATAVFGGAGAVLGNELGRYSMFGKWAERAANKWEPTRKMFSWLHPHGIQSPSFLGAGLSIATFSSIGAAAGRHFSVRPTELDADAKGAAISGDPLALASALGQLQSHAHRSTFKTVMAQVRSGYPSTEKRIANLEQIASQQPMVPVLAELEAAQRAQQAAAENPHAPRPQAAVSHITGAERVAAVDGPALA